MSETVVKIMKIMAGGLMAALVVAAPMNRLQAQEGFIPPYITDGLNTYQSAGYEAAVHVWLKGSPFENASAMASRIAFFKNIEMLAGKYQTYEIVTTKHTSISNMVYVRMVYERTSAYIRFISIKRHDQWILSNIHLDRHQKLA